MSTSDLLCSRCLKRCESAEWAPYVCRRCRVREAALLLLGGVCCWTVAFATDGPWMLLPASAGAVLSWLAGGALDVRLKDGR